MRAIALVVMAVCGLVLGACDGSSSPEAAPPTTKASSAATNASTSASTTTTSTVPTGARVPEDPCTLLDPAELEAIFGMPFSLDAEPQSSRFGLVGCGAGAAGGEFIYVAFSQAQNTTDTMLAACNPDTPDEVQFYAPIAGVGDAASIKNNLPQLCVLADTVVFTMTYTTNRTPVPADFEQAKTFAQAVVARL